MLHLPLLLLVDTTLLAITYLDPIEAHPDAGIAVSTAA